MIKNILQPVQALQLLPCTNVLCRSLLDERSGVKKSGSTLPVDGDCMHPASGWVGGGGGWIWHVVIIACDINLMHIWQQKGFGDLTGAA